MVGPEQHHAVAGAVNSLKCVDGCLGDTCRLEGEVLEAGGEVLGEIVARRGVVRVAEDGDIGVQRLKVLTGVLHTGV